MKPQISIVDAITGEQIVREMNDDEFAQHQIDEATAAQREVLIETKKVEKLAVLERLGITADEAKLLIS